MSVTDVRDGPVFGAGGRSFTWVDVIDAARARGDWAALEGEVAGLLAREDELAATGALPDNARTRLAGNEFRHDHHLLTADEMMDWLSRRDISLDEWTAEMGRSLLDPTENQAPPAADRLERACWVHAVCSGKLQTYARTFAEEVAVQLSEQQTMPPSIDRAGLAAARERFCRGRLTEAALAAEIDNNVIGWTQLDICCLAQRDEVVAREAALCLRVDDRELADVAADVGVELRAISLLLDDAPPALHTWLIVAGPGEIVGPVAVGAEYWLARVERRVPPSLDDAVVRARAATTIAEQALAAEVNRHVNWHEHI